MFVQATISQEVVLSGGAWLEEADGASILVQFVSVGTYVSFQVLAVVPTEELEEPEREDRGQGMVALQVTIGFLV